ncbi:5-hydroxytryptamine receptor 1 [Drosophila albomicans]|uniref:5-hydroxytryptamine receptor 1 n=1 Tax=Drosophila albomicans TaxID=7291 RepID=A0A6P8XIL3_DROAB|nr:5-hydroxytryptamine receptor 1 [Drosophila albomicans]XP_034112548.1 5-hydroxytryptamine receptor 1 [Drosophila albomicans]XP_051864134.1 5-hydroxytryptamine receptor 1 [Drosophila albomicans]
MASTGQDCAVAAARKRRHQTSASAAATATQNCNSNNSNKLISTATLTLFILTLSSWIAYATAAVTTTTTTATAATASVATTAATTAATASIATTTTITIITAQTATRSGGDLAEDFNSSSAFLGAIAAAGGATAAVNSSPIAIVSYQGITSSTPNGSSTVVSMSDTPRLLDELSTDEEFELPALQSVIVSIILLIVILGTVVGNVLVCIAVCMVRKLRRPCNYLLVSLALSDLCVALLVMPMALLYEVLERWSFGTLLCDIWVSFDVLCCTASILNLCAISVDRYLAITKPLEYGVKRTPRRMMLCVGIVWLAAACISLPPLLILGNEHEDEDGQPICTVCQNFAYQIYATLGSFYIPLSVMLFVYYQIFRAARRIVLEEKRAQTHLQQALNGTGSPQTATAPTLGHTDLGSGNGAGHHGHRHSSVGNTSLTYSTCGGLSTSGGGGGGVVGIPHGHHGSGGGVSGSTGLLGSPHHKKLRFQLAKEKKASTTLGIIMSAFTICWLPFFILALIRPFETMHVPPSLSSLFLWLGYANSLLNPIIYATLNRDFRKPFQEILFFRCSSLNSMMRENYYQDQYGEPPSQRVMLGDERHGARESFL